MNLHCNSVLVVDQDRIRPRWDSPQKLQIAQRHSVPPSNQSSQLETRFDCDLDRDKPKSKLVPDRYHHYGQVRAVLENPAKFKNLQLRKEAIDRAKEGDENRHLARRKN